MRGCCVGMAVACCVFTAVLRAAEGPRVVGKSPANEAAVLTMPDGALRVFYTNMEAQRVESIESADDGATWSAPMIEFSTEGRTHHACAPLLDADGELHVFFLRKRGEGRPANGYFIDVYHRRTVNGRAAWTEADPVYVNGYTGALRGAEQLDSGRLLVSINAWVKPDEPFDPAFGRNYLTALISDNNGRLWRQSPSKLVAPIDAAYNGILYGAVEPTLLKMADGSLWMLARNQSGYLYESRSTDDGETWSPAEPSPFHTSNSPCDLLRLRDGRIVLLWNNCQVPPRDDGAGIDAGRDVVHAAISADEGATWRGFREIYLDPTRDLSPPRKGDRGSAYPSGTQTAAGDVFVVTGQADHARAMVRFDPDWLLETSRADDLEAGLDDWSVFKDVGKSIGWWRDRVPGARLVADPDDAGNRVLHLRRPDEQWGDGATWNFPLGRRGELKLRARVEPGFGGGSIALTDCFHNPSDDLGEHRAMFLATIDTSGAIGGRAALTPGKWHALTLTWSVDDAAAALRVDGGEPIELSLQTPTRTGVSYLRLRSSATDVDTIGWMADDFRVAVEPE